ncbi:MAG: FAD-binding protein [Acidimicrobiales bacterium]|nr:FAD-binding protein [Acidimicrobiales bacterium]
MGLRSPGTVLSRFADTIGAPDAGPVAAVGGRTRWSLGGALEAGTREVPAPCGVVGHEPGEMIVRVRAGTTLAELDEAISSGGQFTPLEAPEPERSTVGGVLACGWSGIRRLGWGPVRDAVLEVTAVNFRGELIRAGAPLVKNVTGFDLCRLLVGSLGTLALLGEVVLRCLPRPELEVWWRSDDADPFELLPALYRPLAVLWDGQATWVGLSGYAADVEEQSRNLLGRGFQPVAGPPEPPGPGRRSLAPAAVARLGSAGPPPGSAGGGRWLAEVGVGIVHCDDRAATALPVAPAEPGVVGLHRRIKERFDPVGRLAPGRSVLAMGAS